MRDVRKKLGEKTVKSKMEKKVLERIGHRISEKRDAGLYGRSGDTG